MNPPTSTDPNRSCLTCPSLLMPSEAISFFDKSVGTPVCARYGKPIGTIKTNEVQKEVIAKQVARNCPSYGEPKPNKVNWSDVNLLVALPDPDTIGAPKVQPDLVRSCIGCGNFVREDVVANDLGWTAGLCAAKGKLLLSNRYTFEARNCEERTFAPVRTSASHLIMLPEYDDAFAGSNDPVQAHFRSRRNFVDPTEYPTDKPVSDEDHKHGIRAWRELVDFETGNKVHLPIYRVDFFSPEEQSKIPRTGDDEHPEDYVDHGQLTYKVAVLWTQLDETPALWGQPGTGKTEFFRYMAWLMCLPFERFSITASTELDDLQGKMLYSKERGTYWQDGRVVEAWSKPCVIDVDEPNAGQNDVWQFLRPMTDNSKQLVLDANEGERRTRHDDCYLGLAMNPAWDMRNIGTHQIADADARRMMHLFVELPPEELEKEIIKTACKRDGWDIPKEKVDAVMGIAKDIRGLCDDGTLNISWAVAPNVKVARLLRWFDYITAYRMASADYLEPQAQDDLLTAVRTHIAT